MWRKAVEGKQRKCDPEGPKEDMKREDGMLRGGAKKMVDGRVVAGQQNSGQQVAAEEGWE